MEKLQKNAKKNKFPCLKMAFDVIESGGTAPAVLNASNEIAVNLFLKNKIKFTER